MADIAKAAIVSKENQNGLLVEETIKNSPSDDSNSLTECSVANYTNNCSNQNAYTETKEGGYQEIDSFSELSFKTTDEISLQDIIESEFAARISNINGDECAAKTEDSWDTSDMNKSHDPFDDLFEDYNEKDLKSPDCVPVAHEKDLLSVEANDNLKNQVVSNLDDFISGPMQGDTSLITDYLEEYAEEEKEQIEINNKKSTKSVNIFKLDRPEEIPILTNFDPFTAIEEDSECSNPLANSNVLNSPDEFQFPESPVESQSLQSASPIVIIEKTKIYDENIPLNKSNDVMRELFTKTISDENLEDLTEQNYEQNDEDQSKFHVADSMASVTDSLPNVSSLLSPDKIEVDEFFSSEDIFITNEEGKERKVNEGDCAKKNSENLEAKEISSPGNIELFIDDEDLDNFSSQKSHEEQTNQENPDLVNAMFSCEEENKWTTVEEVLKAQPENFELEGDQCLANATNNFAKPNNVVEIYINDASQATTLQVNGLSESDSGTETNEESSEKKTVKKKKSKKGKKSDEKENISVEPASNNTEKSKVSSSTLEDLEDLSNVSVKNLMLTYSSEAPKSLQNRWYSKLSEPVPLQNLKARSMVDLTSNSKKVAALRSNLFQNSQNLETSRSTTNLSSGERHPVVTGVSVQALKSSFSKFDQLSKKTILHVRSVDASKVQKQFNEASTGSSEITCNCKSCGKQVFQMEQIKAEKSVWHKNCFRCKECNKQLSVDTYSSNEGILYCKPHFKELFKPKAVLEEDTEPIKLKKPELIIRENQPVELPPEVVRASDKPDLGLEELASLNVKSRYQVFEKGDEATTEPLEKSPSSVSVKRSPSILSKLAKFQKKGIDVGVRDEDLNGLPVEQSSSSSEEEEEKEEKGEESISSKKIVKSKKVRERPMSFSKMDDVKSVWENGVAKTREELREERKAEIHQIRSKLFMGKQIKMKEAYEQAVRESENMSPRKSIEVKSEKAKSIKECFEKGEPLNLDDENEGEEKKKVVEDDMSLFEAGISKKSRSLFLELDKSAKTQTSSNIKKASPKSPNSLSPRGREVSRHITDNIVKSTDAIEDVQIETADISSKFKFFESYKEPEREKKKFRITPPREGQVKTESPEKEIFRDPNVVRASDKVEHEIIRTNTTAKMLSLFRQMEEKTEEIPEGPKPLKRFTPPPDYKGESEGESGETEESEEEEEEEEEEANPSIIRASDKVEDEYLKQAANAARAKQLRAKFEKWEEKEKEREESLQVKVNGSVNNAITENSENVEVTSIECTKSLRARFESMKGEADHPKEKVTRPKVNRFVEIQNNMAELCNVCRRRVYQLEKIETSGKIFHKACFRCTQCNCLLRMESFTLNCGNLYCLPHFKQKFISKGNYDEGFGVDQHKAKWPTVTSF